MLLLREEGREELCVGDGGSAEKVIDAPLPTKPVDAPAELDRTCGMNRGDCPLPGVFGTCAMCATPFGGRSMLRSVVGLVLAAILLKVCGSDR